jgi:hypothetical protein
MQFNRGEAGAHLFQLSEIGHNGGDGHKNHESFHTPMVAPFFTMAEQVQSPTWEENTLMKAGISRFLGPAVLGAAALAFAAVNTDYDHHVDFARYHTYSWIGVRAGNSLWQDRITAAVDSSLQAKGWQRVPSGGDAAVSAFGRTTEQDSLETFYNGFPGWGWRGWGGMGSSTTEVIPQAMGNLTVDIFDAAGKHLIWRGTATEALSGKPEKNEKKLEHAISEMFKHFPPRAKT